MNDVVGNICERRIVVQVDAVARIPVGIRHDIVVSDRHVRGIVRINIRSPLLVIGAEETVVLDKRPLVSIFNVQAVGVVQDRVVLNRGSPRQASEVDAVYINSICIFDPENRVGGYQRRCSVLDVDAAAIVVQNTVIGNDGAGGRLVQLDACSNVCERVGCGDYGAVSGFDSEGGIISKNQVANDDIRVGRKRLTYSVRIAQQP